MLVSNQDKADSYFIQ